ncbi:MAG: hypothetical protein KIT09_07540 [Bryobacteraceae bacterium]|nr:hypothetical protein [Bryobacteraceae bacterium]
MAAISVELFAYPWDILEATPERFLDHCVALGVTRAHVTVSYHSGKFLLPRNRSVRVYFPEPGALYFQPDAAAWAGGLAQPVSRLAGSGWLERLARGAAERSIELSAWAVFFHNSALGAAYPDLAVQNAFGDVYPFALCPSHEAVRDHAAALCRSVAALGIFSGVDLETIGYLGYFHGHHHEVTAIPLGMAEKFLLSLCFCPACRAACGSAGVDAESLAAAVRGLLDRRMQSDDASGGQDEEAEHVATLLVACPALAALIRLRMETVTALVKRLSVEAGSAKLAAFTSSFVGSPSNIWMEGVSPTDVGELVECFHLLAYAPDVAQVNSELVFFLALTSDPARVNLTLNLGLPLTTSFSQAAAKVEYALRQGVRRFSFFNYGFLGEARLRWIGDLARIARGDSR